MLGSEAQSMRLRAPSVSPPAAGRHQRHGHSPRGAAGARRGGCGEPRAPGGSAAHKARRFWRSRGCSRCLPPAGPQPRSSPGAALAPACGRGHGDAAGRVGPCEAVTAALVSSAVPAAPRVPPWSSVGGDAIVTPSLVGRAVSYQPCPTDPPSGQPRSARGSRPLAALNAGFVGRAGGGLVPTPPPAPLLP